MTSWQCLGHLPGNVQECYRVAQVRCQCKKPIIHIDHPHRSSPMPIFDMSWEEMPRECRAMVEPAASLDSMPSFDEDKIEFDASGCPVVRVEVTRTMSCCRRRSRSPRTSNVTGSHTLSCCRRRSRLPRSPISSPRSPISSRIMTRQRWLDELAEECNDRLERSEDGVREWLKDWARAVRCLAANHNREPRPTLEELTIAMNIYKFTDIPLIDLQNHDSFLAEWVAHAFFSETEGAPIQADQATMRQSLKFMVEQDAVEWL